MTAQALTTAQYRAAYLAPVIAAKPRTGPLPSLPPRIFYRPKESDPAPRPLEQLYEAGVLGGHAASRQTLGPRISEAVAQAAAQARAIDGLRDDVTRLEHELTAFRKAHDAHVRQFEAAVEQARARVRELEESTFWRMTAPLRYTVHRLKLAVRSARALRGVLRLAPSRLATAKQILREGGVGELARRVRRKLLARSAFPPG